MSLLPPEYPYQRIEREARELERKLRREAQEAEAEKQQRIKDVLGIPLFPPEDE